MKLIYSLWTEPMRFNVKRQNETKWLYALSVAYANQLGYKTALHTDSLGYDLLKDLPFNDFKMTLDNLDADPGFWSYPKIVALKNETAPFIHIDGDAWIKSQYLKDLLEIADYDVAVQMVEKDYMWNHSYEPFAVDVAKLCNELSHLQWDSKKAYNTGIMAFKNEALKTSFVDTYEAMMNCLKDYRNKSEVNVLIEQFNLYSMCKVNNNKVLKLLDFEDTLMDIDEIAKQIGFTHLWGQSKWKPDVQDQVREKLKEVNFKLYALCTS